MVSTGHPKRRRSQYLGMREPHRIPDELLSEILSWLPARSVIRLKCVCKLWRSITHDPCFINAHVDHARNASPPSILFFHSSQIWGKYGITIIDCNSMSAPKLSLRWPKLPQPKFSVGNSCNGLLCIYAGSEDERIKVINPTTAECITLPQHTNTRAGHTVGAYLGFHPETKEYKVIRFFFAFNNHWSSQVACEVCTLGTSNWRHICILDQYSSPGRIPTPVFVKGTMYWLQPDPCSVLSFDLKGENFTRVSEIRQRKHVYHHLVELQGNVCLTVTAMGHTSRQMDIRMLISNVDDLNNTKYEWALKHSVLLPICDGFSSTPLYIHKEKILVHSKSNSGIKDIPGELVCCRLNNKVHGSKVSYRIRSLIYDNLNGQYEIDEYFFRNYGVRCFEPFVHVESLVPLQSK